MLHSVPAQRRQLRRLERPFIGLVGGQMIGCEFRQRQVNDLGFIHI